MKGEPAPFVIVVVPLHGTHLSDKSSGGTSWCGVDVRGGVSFQYEPGADFGEHPDDCRKCVRELRNHTGLP